MSCLRVVGGGEPAEVCVPTPISPYTLSPPVFFFGLASDVECAPLLSALYYFSQERLFPFDIFLAQCM